jgi:hypothetical protein
MKAFLAALLLLTIGCAPKKEKHQPWTGETQSPNYPPVAAAPEPDDPDAQAARAARNKAYNLYPESKSSVVGSNSTVDRSAPVPDLPENCDTVIIGSVVKEQPYQAGDNSLYTEYTVSVENLLRNTLKKKLPPTGQITVVRPGGAIRLPDGKLLQANSNLPGPLTVGHRYVLFLRYDDSVDWYRLEKPWELRDEVVVPVNASDKNSPHSGEKEKDFLDYFLQHEVRPPAGTTPK